MSSVTSSPSQVVAGDTAQGGSLVLPVAGLFALSLSFLMSGQFVPWIAFQQEWMAALGALLIVADILRKQSRSHALEVSGLSGAALVLAAVAVLQYATDRIWFTSDAVLSAAYLAAFAFCVMAGRFLSGSDRRWIIDGLFAALLVSALASTAIALSQWQQLRWSFLIKDLQPGGRPFANLGQPNHLATLLSMGLVGVLLFYESKRLSATTTIVIALFLGWGLVMTQSRMAWVVAALLLVWWFLNRHRVGLRLTAKSVVLGVALFVAAVIAWDFINRELLIAQATSLDARLNSSSRRTLLWQILWDAAWREPWTGYGWGQVPAAQHAVSLDHDSAGVWLLQGHNLLLDLMITSGAWLGLAVFVALAVWFVRQILACRTVEQWALLAAVGAVFAHSMFEQPLHFLYFLLPAGLMMGILEALHPPGPSLRLPVIALAPLVAALGALLVWVGVEYLRVEAAVQQLRFVMLGIGVDKVPDAPPPQVRLLDQPRELHRYMLSEARPGMTSSQLEWMRRVSIREPRPAVMLQYALATGLNGDRTSATETLAKLCKMHAMKFCIYGQDSWKVLQSRHDSLRPIAFPVLPEEPR